MGISLGEISKQLQLNPSTTHHLLATLLKYQVVEQDPFTKRYRLGIHLIELGNTARESTSLARITSQYLETIWERTEQACSLLVFHGLMRTHILGYNSRKMLTAQRTPLDSSTLHATGSGKLLLAYLPERELQDYLRSSQLARYTAATITDPEKLYLELAHIREVGYSLDNDEYSKGVRCISAPIQDSSLHIAGCIDVVFPASNVSEEQFSEWIDIVRTTADKLSFQLRGIGLVAR